MTAKQKGKKAAIAKRRRATVSQVFSDALECWMANKVGGEKQDEIAKRLGVHRKTVNERVGRIEKMLTSEARTTCKKALLALVPPALGVLQNHIKPSKTNPLGSADVAKFIVKSTGVGQDHSTVDHTHRLESDFDPETHTESVAQKILDRHLRQAEDAEIVETAPLESEDIQINVEEPE